MPGAPLWAGVAVAALTGAVFGLLHAFLTVGLALSQHVSGLGITLLATALSYYGYRVSFPEGQHAADRDALRADGRGCASRCSTRRRRSRCSRCCWCRCSADSSTARRWAWRCAWSARTRRRPRARASRVAAARTGAIVAGSALMGVAGSFLTLSAFNAFFFNMVNGRGWICVALVVFASWRPGKALLGALLFAFFDALQLRLQQSGDAVAALPALPDAAVRAVDRGAGAGGAQGRYPQALMKPYRKGER